MSFLRAPLDIGACMMHGILQKTTIRSGMLYIYVFKAQHNLLVLDVPLQGSIAQEAHRLQKILRNAYV